jgi:hypothetical protein
MPRERVSACSLGVHSHRRLLRHRSGREEERLVLAEFAGDPFLELADRVLGLDVRSDGGGEAAQDLVR